MCIVCKLGANPDALQNQNKRGRNMHRLILLSAFFMATAIAGGLLLTVDGQQTKTATDGPYTAAKTGNPCTSNECKPIGCASCVKLQVNLPLTAQVIKVHCWANAGYPNDLPHGQFQEVACGVDVAWSIFEPPVTTTTTSNTVVTTRYHNRSGDRDRDVKLTVDYQ